LWIPEYRHVNSFVFAGLSALITHLKKVNKDKSREERDVEVGEREGEGEREREGGRREGDWEGSEGGGGRWTYHISRANQATHGGERKKLMNHIFICLAE